MSEGDDHTTVPGVKELIQKLLKTLYTLVMQHVVSPCGCIPTLFVSNLLR